MRTRIKICGITNSEDARAAVDYGTDALGFILVPGSPRYRSPEESRKLIWELPLFVSSVAVCKNTTDLSREYEGVFQAIQFYNPVPDQGWHWYGNQFLVYAARIQDGASLDKVAESIATQMTNVGGECMIDALLLDTFHKDKLGGSGETFNWDLAIEAKKRFELPIILAGGLTPDNVEEAIAKVCPYAVDVSSGVEAEPGRKDHAKLKAFIRAVQKANNA